MLGILRLPRPLLALVTAGPFVASLLATSSPATAAPTPTPTAAWTVRWDSQPLNAKPTTLGGPYGSFSPSISGDGTAVSFNSTSRLDSTGFGYPDQASRAFLRRAGAPGPVRLAVGPGGVAGNGADPSSCVGCNGGSDVSGDGRTAVFVSSSDNLTPGDTNGTADIFRRDLTTGAVTLVSHGPGGVAADGASDAPQVSNDGRWVLFYSAATNLTGVSMPAFGARPYLYDALTDQVRYLSAVDHGAGNLPALSGNGAKVAIDSYDRLVPSDLDRQLDTYVVDLATGATTLASVTTGGSPLTSLSSSISDDGTIVALSYRQGTSPTRVAVRDLTTGVTTTVPGTKASAIRPKISGNGRRLAMNLYTVGTSALSTVVTDLSGTVLFQSQVDPEGRMTTSIDADGSCVAFSTTVAEVAADLNRHPDVYTACQS